MKLEQQVVSLELAKKMKELGFKQESLFYWINREEIPGKTIWCLEFADEQKIDYLKKSNFDIISAYTVAELGEMLPDHFHTQKSGVDYFIQSQLPSQIALGHYEFSETEADVRAKMLIYLKENNLT